MNRYLEFVSDEEFLECIKYVVDAYIITNDMKTPIELI